MKIINWKIHCRSDIDKVFSFFTSDEGRRKFWAESAVQNNDTIHFMFPNGQEYKSLIKEIRPPNEFAIDYFSSDVTFLLQETDDAGTDLQVINSGVKDEEFYEVQAGWISVLLALKAAVDFNIDLRNHDKTKTWDQQYVDN
jgi:uncharacterized protein YndB with AHSA1/START domain